MKTDYVNKMKQAGFEVKIISEDKEISEKQYQGIALESLKLEATKKNLLPVDTNLLENHQTMLSVLKMLIW